MRTKLTLSLAALAASLTTSAVQAKDAVTIDRIGGRAVEIITASARDTGNGLRVSGLVRRAPGRSLPPVAAHLDVSAFDPDGHWAITVPTRLAALSPQRTDREPARFEATFPLLHLASVTKLEVRYQDKPHAMETGEVAR